MEISIEDWCEKFEIKNYIINNDGTVDTMRSLDIHGRDLERIPIQFGIVGGVFYCHENRLVSLKGSPKTADGINCSHNELPSLEFCTKNVELGINCESNNLISLEGAPIGLFDIFVCKNNPIYEIYKLFGNNKAYGDSLDYNYLRGTNIIKLRFQEALEEVNKNVPESIKGYKYI